MKKVWLSSLVAAALISITSHALAEETPAAVNGEP